MNRGRQTYLPAPVPTEGGAGRSKTFSADLSSSWKLNAITEKESLTQSITASRFLVSFFAVCILSFFLEQGFRRIQQRLLHHQRILKESENHYHQAYEQLNIEMQERKRAEEALLNAAQQWRSTFDSISDFVSLLDLEGNILRCNMAMKNFIGKPFNEILNRPCWEMVLGIKTPIEGCPFSRMRETLHRETTTFPLKDRWFHVSTDPIFDESDHLIGAVNIITDVTDRKQAEEALRESEERYRTILEDIEDGYFEVDIAGNFTFFNDSLCRMLGYTKDELMGMNNKQYMDKETAKKVYQVFNQVYTSLGQDNRLRQDVLEIMNASKRASSLTNQLLAFS
jgi:PAS domain S-box-containing protein